MTKTLFKGIQQVTWEYFNSPDLDKKGYLWFVREPQGENTGLGDDKFYIYFGTRCYGSFWEGEHEALATSLTAIKNALELGDDFSFAWEGATTVVDAFDKIKGWYDALALRVDAVEKNKADKTALAKNYSEAKTLSNALVVGQLIKVSEEETITEGEGEESKEVTYQAGFYIVEGAGVISALATSTGSDDEVGVLKGRVYALETTVGNEEAGLVKEVADNAAAIETKVTKEDGKRLMTDAEGSKLAGISEGAQVNVIETVKVNGTALEVTDKAVNIEIESIKVKGVDGADKMLTLTETGEVKSELSITYVKSEDSEDGKPYIALFGKGGTTLIDAIDASN